MVTRPFALVTLAAFAYFASYAMLIPTLPRYVQGPLGSGEVAVGMVAGSFGITALLLRPFVGLLADRRGRRLAIVAGSAIAGTATLGLALTSSLALTIVLRLIAGMGEALFFVGAATVITDLAPPERRGEALSLFSIALYGGIALGPLLAETVLDAWGFTAAFAASAALTTVALLLALPTPETRPPTEAVRASLSLRRVLHPAGIFPGFVMLTSVWGFAGFMAFLPLYADELELAGARGILLMYGLIMVSIRLFGARIPDRYGAARVGKAGLALSAAGLALVGTWGGVRGLILGTIVFASGQALAFPAFMALSASAAPPAERAAAVGTTTAFIDLGFFVGPVTFGVVAAAFEVRTAFLLGSLIAVLGVALQVSAARARRARAVSPALAEG